jgi:N-formylglutamate amidohydrolase
MPSSGRVGHNDPGSLRADVVPGSRGRTSAAARVIDCPDRLARERGYSVAHDIPYRGGFTTGHYGRPDVQVHAVQIELNRRLYMNEVSLERLPGRFDEIRSYCKEVVTGLGAMTQRDLGIS